MKITFSKEEIIDVGSFDADVSSSLTSTSDNFERSGKIESLSKEASSSNEKNSRGELLELKVEKTVELFDAFLFDVLSVHFGFRHSSFIDCRA